MTSRPALLRRSTVLRDGSDLLVRPTRSADAPALVALRDSVAAEREFIAAVPGERSILEEEMSLVGLLSQGGLSIVGEAETRVVGHLLVHRRTGDDAGHVADLAIIVHKQWRGLGVGTCLITVAIEWCRIVGVRKLCLGVFTSNARAISLYRMLGFRDETVRRAQSTPLQPDDRELLLMALHP